jgi:uncharacterized protein (DUF427 family)
LDADHPESGVLIPCRFTFSIPLGGDRSANAVWTYDAPYAAVTLIKDYLAFYPDRVDAIEERHGE